ncbi:hypothetical protein SPRG_13002 [Saprolegnia parasitica CBS 223.65]|uniref:F-box domain-containing protein n=1 Tax=Saprolegnia parasitica (strain CBS 223.65) TaxID=695850 RepID=A0A067BT35_SAPPC|nr:hypothetical protein SPRG_13002 [Saprolegnia parasitica CBS 223.65]KDO21664.1 hypothetical protein SPRG_13002 [Saprolegnia parasitica CBS 223.65]|eukprot:XP_012207588.1 hypothetical protein SPRG_13002 [Saprolegnia parasitica CBS 223.65]
MADSGRQTKVARPTPPDALALPHVVEAIAMCLKNQEDFSSFLYALPHSLWTPALSAFLDCATDLPASLVANWPRIVLATMAFPPLVLTVLAATLPLRPRMELHCSIRDAAPLASLVAVVGPALNTVTLQFYRGCMVQGQSQAISDILLQRCPRLRQVSISVHSYSENETVELNSLLAVVAHPHIEDVTIVMQRTTIAPPRLWHLLAAWLSTAPATKLRLAYIARMDHDAVIAFCDALQANTTLQELTIFDVPSLGGFHGRTLPVSLKTLAWKIRPNRNVDDATLTDLATAVVATQLERLECIVFGQLATCPAAAPMLSQLQCLIVSGVNADNMEALIDGLSSVPALTSLTARTFDLSLSAELLMETLATTCVHLETLRVDDQLVAAGRHLRCLTLNTIGRDIYDLEKRAICKALARVPDVPFVLQNLPKDMDKFVVDALSPRADRRHQCMLYF